MAQPKIMYTCAFFLALIFFSYGILLSEGRVFLKKEKNSNTIFSHHGENSHTKVVKNNYFNNIDLTICMAILIFQKKEVLAIALVLVMEVDPHNGMQGPT